MSSMRQLAAIMFTDIVGYTALMGRDEQRAFDILQKNRQLQKPLIEQHGGKWIKELGDGVLASFSTISDAVQAAIKIQEACNQTKEFCLRIGIHQGEVVFDQEDIFGDAVNIASRIQALAPAGGIWISEAVFNNISNKKSFPTKFIEEVVLKNVKEPVRIYEVQLEHSGTENISKLLPATSAKPRKRKHYGKKIPATVAASLVLVMVASLGYFLYAYFQDEQKSTGVKKSIAVLYFDNMSGDPEQEYFSDGITEEIITHLASIKDLRVISRTSVLSYKGKPHHVKKIAKELNVATLLEGSVRKSGNTLRITAQLINAKTDEHIWSETFNKPLNSIFEVQSEIARTIAQKLKAEINPEAVALINHQPTSSLAAYDAFQKGKFFYYKKYGNTGRSEDFEKAKNFLERAIQLDSSYADAYAGLSDLYDEFRNRNLQTFPKRLLDLKTSLARKAFQLNPNSAFVNYVLSWALLHRPDPDLDSGYYYARKAYYLEPTNTIYSLSLAWLLGVDFGVQSTAIRLMQKTIETDPLDPGYYAFLGSQYAMLGKYTEARQTFQKCMELTDETFKLDGALLLWLIYFKDYKEVEKRLSPTGENHELLQSLLFAAKGKLDKIKPEHRSLLAVLLVANQKKASEEVIRKMELEVEKKYQFDLVDYDFLTHAYYFDVYRDRPDFKRILWKAKKKEEEYLSKYGQIDIPD